MKILVCGTRAEKIRNKTLDEKYRALVHKSLSTIDDGNLTIIEGCCPDSADQYAEEYVQLQAQAQKKISIKHHPSHEGNYLKRNIEMVKECDEVLAFWNGWSYGTSHTIAHACLNKKPVRIVSI